MTNIPWRPSHRRLRQFAAIWLVFSLVLLVRWSWTLGDIALDYRSASFTVFAGVLAVATGVIGLFKPQLLRPLYVGWMIAVFPIGWTVSRLVLAILFYGVFTPLGLCFRILGRDALGLKLQPDTASYWTLKEIPEDPRRYFQQF